MGLKVNLLELQNIFIWETDSVCGELVSSANRIAIWILDNLLTNCARGFAFFSSSLN